MATQLEDKARGLAFERFRDALEGRRTGYPNGATFVSSEVPYLGKVLAHGSRQGNAVVVVFPDGDEMVVNAPRPRRHRLRGLFGRH